MSLVESEEFEVMESEIYEFLPSMNASQLETLYTKIDLTIPEASKGKKNVLLRGMNSHLAGFGDLEDGGFANLKIVHEFLTKNPDEAEVKVKPDESLLEKKLSLIVNDEHPIAGLAGVDAIVNARIEELLKKLNPSTDSPSASEVDKKSETEKREVKRREDLARVQQVPRPVIFKLTGEIGGSKSISYENLKFQTKNAYKQGYIEQNIIAAVIRAISSENDDLRTLFELQDEPELELMLKMLEPIMKQKDSATYFSDLCNAVQTGSQNCLDFVVGLLSLKKKILVRSQQEGIPFDKSLLSKQLMKTMYSGIKNTNIRSEIRDNCRSLTDMSDTDLLKIVGDAMSIEQDRIDKFGSKKAVGFNVVTTNEGTKTGKNKENLLPALVQELKLSHDTQLACLKSDMDELKSLVAATVQMVSAQNSSFNNNNNPLEASCQNQQNNPQFKMWRSFQPAGNARPGSHVNNNKSKVPNRCTACVAQNIFKCIHCSLCGDEGHRSYNCPTKATPPAAGSGNGNGL